MVLKTKNLIFAELKESFKDWKTTLKVMGKDSLFYSFAIMIFLIYSIILLKYMPANPGLSKEAIIFASADVTNNLYSQLQNYYLLLVIGAVVGILIILAAFTFTKEWIWAGIQKTKINYKKLYVLLGITLILYTLVSGIIFLVMFLSGLLFRAMMYANIYQWIMQFLAIIVLILSVVFALQILNHSSYTFTKKRKFVASLLEPFKSFSKTKELLLPYLAILIIVTILGLLSNLFTSVKIVALNIIGLILLIYFLAWQRIYSNKIFERIYK